MLTRAICSATCLANAWHYKLRRQIALCSSVFEEVYFSIQEPLSSVEVSFALERRQIHVRTFRSCVVFFFLLLDGASPEETDT